MEIRAIRDKGGPLYHILFIHSPTDGHLGYCHILAVVTDTTMIVGEQTTLQDPTFSSSGYVPQVVFLDHMEIVFKIFETPLTISHSNDTILHPYQQCTKVID